MKYEEKNQYYFVFNYDGRLLSRIAANDPLAGVRHLVWYVCAVHGKDGTYYIDSFEKGKAPINVAKIVVDKDKGVEITFDGDYSTKPAWDKLFQRITDPGSINVEG